MADGDSGFPGGMGGAGMAGLGALGDIWGFIQNWMQQQQQQKIQQTLMDPNKIAQGFPGVPAALQRDLNAQYAVSTGGAPGGAYNQYLADAFAKYYLDWMAQRIGALKGASAVGPGIQNQPIGGLGGIMKNLQALQAIRGPQQPQGLVAGFPTQGGGGFGGGSEGWRGDYSPLVYQPPVDAGTIGAGFGSMGF